MTDPTPTADPDDVQLEQLTVQELGEDGDSYIVIGTVSPALAVQAFTEWWNRTAGEYAGLAADEALDGLLPYSRDDWYWQDDPDRGGDEEEYRWLRAVGPSLDGKTWGNGMGDLPEHADEPLFRGVYFG